MVIVQWSWYIPTFTITILELRDQPIHHSQGEIFLIEYAVYQEALAMKRQNTFQYDVHDVMWQAFAQIKVRCFIQNA